MDSPRSRLRAARRRRFEQTLSWTDSGPAHPHRNGARIRRPGRDAWFRGRCSRFGTKTIIRPRPHRPVRFCHSQTTRRRGPPARDEDRSAKKPGRRVQRYPNSLAHGSTLPNRPPAPPPFLHRSERAAERLAPGHRTSCSIAAWDCRDNPRARLDRAASAMAARHRRYPGPQRTPTENVHRCQTAGWPAARKRRAPMPRKFVDFPHRLFRTNEG